MNTALSSFERVCYSPYLHCGKVCIICWQDFDLVDYNKHLFYHDKNDNIIKFDTEWEAKRWIVDNINQKYWDEGDSFLTPEMTLTSKSILDFISIFSPAKELFLYGCCYHFAVILIDRFQGKMYYNQVANHFTMMYNGRLYDASGDVTSKHLRDSEPWIGFSQYDPLLFGRIERDCILKI